MQYLYLSSLIFSLFGLSLLYAKLGWPIFGSKAGRIAVVGTVSTLMIFDILGIYLGIFSTNGSYVSGVFLSNPDLPMEKPLLLTLISYVCLLLTQREGER